jgi:hypothetical protein
MKTRRHDWYDIKSHKPIYGIQVFHKGQWRNVMNEGKPLLYDNEKDRNNTMRAIKKTGKV